jgi:Uma2 family endonuclease
MTVRIDSETAHEPDALVHCTTVAPEAIEISDPVVVAEVLSPSTRHVDATAKLASYFSRPSVRHYLVVDSDRRVVVHHARNDARTIATAIITTGRIELDPPGIEVELADFFRNLE